MERKVEDLLSRQNLLFAKNPFEKIYKQKLNITRKEMRLRMEPPINCSVIKASLNQNFPKSDISKLKLEPPTAKKAFIKAEDEEIHKISPPAEKFILKITETEGEIYKVHPPVEKVIPKTLEISKKEWANRDFIKLENWFIIHVSNSKNIAIVGYRPDIEELWLTDIILARINANRIITHSKTCYQLVGPIDSSNHESKTIIENFEEGFPENWKEIILKPEISSN